MGMPLDAIDKGQLREIIGITAKIIDFVGRRGNYIPGIIIKICR